MPPTLHRAKKRSREKQKHHQEGEESPLYTDMSGASFRSKKASANRSRKCKVFWTGLAHLRRMHPKERAIAAFCGGSLEDSHSETSDRNCTGGGSHKANDKKRAGSGACGDIVDRENLGSSARGKPRPKDNGKSRVWSAPLRSPAGKRRRVGWSSPPTSVPPSSRRRAR